MSAHNDLYGQAARLRRAGQLDEAAAVYRRILALAPDEHRARFFLAGLRHEVGDHAAAIALLREAIDLVPDEARYRFGLSQALEGAGDLDAAVAAMETARALAPDWPAPYFHLARLLQKTGRDDEAIAHLQRFVEYRPRHFVALRGLARMLNSQRRFKEALSIYRRALTCPCRGDDAAELHAEMAMIQRQLGDLESAVDSYERVLALRPDDHRTHSALLALLSYHVMRSPEELLAAHRLWDERHGLAGRRQAFVHRRDDAPGRRLRIGYLSPDLREHAVAFFMRPLLEGHDPDAVEVYAYADLDTPDTVSERLAEACDHWTPVGGLDDEALARRIYDDRIDVLVDLLGHPHTGKGRLRVFTMRPAPIQVTYLGYFSTTGLSAMDYWLSDSILTPVDTVERATERIWRLPRCCLAYRPPETAPEVVPRDDGRIVLACFNNIAKAGAESFALWAEVLERLPRARLMLKSTVLADADYRQQVLDRFANLGIAAERIEMRAMTETIAEHLTMYGEVDIALDTLPRTGGTTTAEALWMGVPVVTLAGRRFIERLSATMLAAVGLDELITHDRRAYVDRVVALAADRQRLGGLRLGLRRRMRASPLCDGRGLAQAIEQAYRLMWRRFLAEGGHGAGD